MPIHVRTLSTYRRMIERLPEFRLISTPLTIELATRIGFDGIPAAGDSIVPAIVGRTTEFNANGYDIVRKDLPMETRSRMIYTSWQDWHGYPHSGIQYRDYKAYPREKVPPPGETLTAIEKDGNIVASSRVIRSDESEKDIVNVINMFLELFNDFEIVQSDFTSSVQVRKVNWKILPPGQYPFARTKQELEGYIRGLPDGDREVATERIRIITRHNPDFLAIGMGGFSDYVVFGFTEKHRYVFESPYSGNATYVFRNEWESISQYSKSEILQGDLQEERVIHSSNWSRRIESVIERA